MNKKHRERLIFVSVLTIGLAIATGLLLYALGQNINVFLTPSELLTSKASSHSRLLRLGGMVKKGSVQREQQSLNVSFVVTDLKKEVPIHYQGILPDLFREGTGVIAEGHLDQTGTFNAKRVLAKHDENYMPKNVYAALKEKNQHDQNLG